MKKIVFIVLAFVSFSVSLNAQANLTLLDGKNIKLDSYFYNYNDGYVAYSQTKPNGKVKQSYRYFEDVYSVSNNGSDTILYSPADENSLTVEEMRKTILGRQTAMNEYKPWWALATGAVVGCGSLLLPVNGSIRLLIPIGYVSGMFFVKPSASNVMKKYPEYGDDIFFVEGYRSAGSNKILKNTLLGTAGGMIISGIILGTVHLVHNN